jgi:uncharacterized protein (TIGR03437 family)
MKRLDWKYLPIGVLFVLSTALAPVFRAQESLAVTGIRADPPDASYSVDGTTYTGPSSNPWPQGSKHVLSTFTQQSPVGQTKIQYLFQGWDFPGGSIPLNPATVTATTAISGYVAHFSVLYALDLVYFNCPDPDHCPSPGKIYVNGVPYNSSTQIFLGKGATALLQAYPNPGWVFVGWQPAANQTIIGFQNSVTLTAPTSVYPVFAPTRTMTLQTVPAGLKILADRAPVESGTTLDWGMGTTHAVGPVSPQQDKQGKYWVFQSWNDGGAATHAYQMGSQAGGDILTATYIPAAGVTIETQPPGLSLKVDGLTAAVATPLNPNYFLWGVGEKHRIEAPTQQTDAQGRTWKFSGWSNGGPAAQDITVPLDADTGGVRLTAAYTQLAKLTVDSRVSALTVTVDGKACAVPCEVTRDIGEKVRVSAPSSVALNDGSRLDFDGWPGGTAEYTATMTDTAQVVAVNYHTMNRFTLASDPPNGVLWRVQPTSDDGFYNAAASVSVSLSAQPGFKFRRWDGDLSGTIPSGVVSMSAPRTVKALLDAVPYIGPAGILNAAGVTPSTGVAAGSVISIFGANLAASSASAGDGLLPQTLAATSVRVAGRLLPLVFASPEQINAILPDDLPEGDQVLIVSTTGQPEVRATFTLARNAPGIFATVTHADGSPVTSDAPARTGELLTVYGTGFGPADRPRLAGFPLPATPDYLIAGTTEVRIGETAATVDKAFAVPGKVGIDAVRFRVADGTVSGPMKVVINGVESNSIALVVQ